MSVSEELKHCYKRDTPQQAEYIRSNTFHHPVAFQAALSGSSRSSRGPCRCSQGAREAEPAPKDDPGRSLVVAHPPRTLVPAAGTAGWASSTFGASPGPRRRPAASMIPQQSSSVVGPAGAEGVSDG